MTDKNKDLISRLMKGDMSAFDELFPNADSEFRAKTECFIKMATIDNGKHLWLAFIAYLFAPRLCDEVEPISETTAKGLADSLEKLNGIIAHPKQDKDND